MRAVSKIMLGVVLTAGLTASMASIALQSSGISGYSEKVMNGSSNDSGTTAYLATVNPESRGVFDQQVARYYPEVSLGNNMVVVLSSEYKTPRAGDGNESEPNGYYYQLSGGRKATVTSRITADGGVVGHAAGGDMLVVYNGRPVGTVGVTGKNLPLSCMQGYLEEGSRCIKNTKKSTE